MVFVIVVFRVELEVDFFFKPIFFLDAPWSPVLQSSDLVSAVGLQYKQLAAYKQGSSCSMLLPTPLFAFPATSVQFVEACPHSLNLSCLSGFPGVSQVVLGLDRARCGGAVWCPFLAFS